MPRRAHPRELAVWANGVRVGEWHMPARSPVEFQYDADWMAAPEARPLSLSLPLTLDRVPHKGPVVEAYFDNLLPDSDSIRRRLQARFQTAGRGAFELLAAIGRDCVGAVQILPADEAPADIRKIDAQPLKDAAVAQAIAAATSPASTVDDQDEFRISIAGAQEKTAFLKYNGRWCRPVGSTPTTHIFKLPLGLVGNRQADMRTSVENEWLCARIVAAFGLPVANCDIEEFGNHKVLVVERFDRQLHSSGRYWLRLMQEDFAQATGTPSHRKYQADGGPGIPAIADILQGSVESTRDLQTLFKTQLVFFLLAATDGHAKNFSIRIHAHGRFQLTPLYDVLSAWPVIGKRANELPFERAKLAMAMPGARPHYLLKTLQRRHFEALARRVGVGMETQQLLDETLAAVPAVIEATNDALPKNFPSTVADRVLDGMRRNAKALAP